MKSFRQFLEQVNKNELRAALGEIDAEASSAEKMAEIRKRAAEATAAHREKVKEIFAQQQKLQAQQAEERRQRAEEQRRKREEEQAKREQERANRRSGTEED